MKVIQSGTNGKQTLDPLVSLIYNESSFRDSNAATTSAYSVASVCFLNRRNETITDEAIEAYSESESDDTDEKFAAPLHLKCQQLLQSDIRFTASFPIVSPKEIASSLELHGRWLGACYSNGDCLLWDLGKRKIIEAIAISNARGPGLTLRRLGDDDSRFLYQTRDEKGTISLHDLNGAASELLGKSNVYGEKIMRFVQTLQTVETYSQSFCVAVPCHGNPNLFVTPCQHHSYVMVRDWRLPPTHHPVAYFHAVTGSCESNGYDDLIGNGDASKCGMVTSLAMAETKYASTTAIACGMESGMVVVHDLAMIRKMTSQSFIEAKQSCKLSLSMDPILSLDLLSSTSRSADASQPSGASFVAIAGMAGNEEDLVELPQCDRGRVAVIKLCQEQDETFRARLRSRISTMVDASSSQYSHDSGILLPSGKPGVGQCRFRSDGRIFAVGGWDKRVRIYDRAAKSSAHHTPLALLRGHDDSVNAIDWSFDAVSSGLIATGSSDGRIHVWRCFPSKVEPV